MAGNDHVRPKVEGGILEPVMTTNIPFLEKRKVPCQIDDSSWIAVEAFGGSAPVLSPEAMSQRLGELRAGRTIAGLFTELALCASSPLELWILLRIQQRACFVRSTQYLGSGATRGPLVLQPFWQVSHDPSSEMADSLAGMLQGTAAVN